MDPGLLPPLWALGSSLGLCEPPGDRAENHSALPLDEILSKVTEVSNTTPDQVQLLDKVHGLALGHRGSPAAAAGHPIPLTSLALLDECCGPTAAPALGPLLG